MRNNKKITWFLIIALVGVWGSIGYQILEALAGVNDAESTHDRSTPLTATSSNEFHFTDRVRDPFRFAVRKDGPPKVAKDSPPWQPPPYRLVGIVTDDDKKTALLEGNDGAVHFVVEGREVNGVKILKIDGKSVDYRFMKVSNTWTLE